MKINPSMSYLVIGLIYLAVMGASHFTTQSEVVSRGRNHQYDPGVDHGCPAPCGNTINSSDLARPLVLEPLQAIPGGDRYFDVYSNHV